ncbi:DNA polymerase I A, chloroplastic/mitochondrial-like isoform X2 [Trifolium pratense]|uniref:DNA polymerase I A, chloroplastic/mitochondrial-like isoform X2 n=1 Tax=Trifolium pratense TaxID=57577 RepID=UPI001E69143B|nr:DNA polymerase I A, chloroplastic/mitochondrial-like isoform X2 [Trifolium pratense]
MWVSSHSATPFRSPYYCSSCLSFSNSSSKPFRFHLASLSFFASYGSPQHRRKMKPIQIANNVLLHSSLSSNSLQFREGSQRQKRISFGLNKCNDMEYRRNSPVHISVMKFSTRREKDLSSLSSFGKKMRAMERLASLGNRLYKKHPTKLRGNKTGWNAARDSLAQTKVEMHDPDNSSLYPSNTNTTASFIGQEQAISRKTENNVMLQDLREPASSSDQQSMLQNSKVSIDTGRLGTKSNASSLNISEEKVDAVNGNHRLATTAKKATNAKFTVTMTRSDEQSKLRERLCSIYENTLVVDNLSLAEEVAKMLTVNYRHLIHACDTEVSKIDVKKETPIDHGEIICFSIYSGPEADFGGGKSCIWVDVLDGGGKEILNKFADFFQDPSIKKVWHNYSFDCHVIQNYGFKLSGFHADTMHMARLWDSSRRWVGGYSLEALSADQKVMSRAKLNCEKDLIGKVSMATIFGQKKAKKDGSLGKMVTIAPVEELQRHERIPWICYSALDARSTLKLYESLKSHLSDLPWKLDGELLRENMFDFYENYLQPFGELLVKMESEGMLVDRSYLQDIEKVAKAEQQAAVNRFRKWACKYCPDAKYMNVGSDAQLRVLLFGGTLNRKNQNEAIPTEKIFKVPNVDGVIEKGKKTPSKLRDIKLNSIGYRLNVDIYTPSGWPSVSGAVLKALAGKVSAEYDFSEVEDEDEDPSECEDEPLEIDNSAYGTAFTAFPTEEEGREACHAIAALCEVCSIDSLIANFILPLQGHNISGKDQRVHCSININTETGRLSARRPSLQNQPALEKDRYKIRQAFIAAPGNSLIVADYGQLELRILAHLTNCKSMLEAFEAGGDFHSRTAMNMYPYIRQAVDNKEVLLEWHPQPGEDKPPVPLLKDAFASERRKAKMLNFSIAYGKTPQGLSKDWKVSVKEAKNTVDLWYNDRKEVLRWQQKRKKEALEHGYVSTLLGRSRRFHDVFQGHSYYKGHIERAAINTPVQGSAADVAMLAMLEISKNKQLKELGWKLLLQVHDEVILEGPTESAEVAKAIVVDCMSNPFNGKNILRVGLTVDAKCAQNWYAAK